MVEESATARPGDPRVSTGNASLDAMLEGGLVARRPYLVVGPSGTGKTTLGIQFLCDGARRGERVLLVTLEEPPNEARVNHRGLEPDLDRVEVFDAIPDIMRYERTPFKDIASVRSAVPFAKIPLTIRRSPELASVEVTITALEQMLRTEVLRKGYTRLVIDSLTALQYFCMKGFDPVGGAQAFLRFLSDLRVTTILTVEAPLEDVETPERMLARGEIRLFRWELDGQTVRAVGVEKFRGSSHDVRLHPYRIGPQGIDINLDVTISRDTRQIIQPIVRMPTPPTATAPVAPFVSAVTPLIDEVRDLVLLGADVAPARTEIEAALAATVEGHPEQAQVHLLKVSSLVMALVDTLNERPRPVAPDHPETAAAYQRVIARADSVRTGVPPTSLPAQSVLQVQLGALLSLLPPLAAAPESPPSPAAAEAVPVAPIPVPPPPAPSVPESTVVPSPEVAAATEVLPVAPVPEPAEAETVEAGLAPVVASPPEPPARSEPSPEAEVAPAPPAPPPTGEPPAAPMASVPAVVPPVEEPAAPEPEAPLVPVPAPAAVVEAPVAPKEEPTPVPPATVKSTPAAEPVLAAPLAKAAVVSVVVPSAHAVRDVTTAPSGPPKATRPKAGKPLPPPPKPRGGLGEPPAPKAIPLVTPPHAEKTLEPPPLPKAAMPDWLAHLPAPAARPESGSSVGPSSAVTLPTQSEPSALRAAPAASRKRRKAGHPAAAKKAATVPRGRPSHELPPAMPSPPSNLAAEAARPTTAPTPAPTPAPGALARPRRRPPRKKKAPPVVSAEVEPIPPGVFGTPEEGPDRDDPTDPSPPSEG